MVDRRAGPGKGAGECGPRPGLAQRPAGPRRPGGAGVLAFALPALRSVPIAARALSEEESTAMQSLTSPGQRSSPRGCIRRVLLGLLLVAGPLGAAPPPTLDELLATPSLFGTPPADLRWSPDGELLAFTWNRAGGRQRGLWLVSADGSCLQRLDDGNSGSVRALAWLPDGSALLSLRDRALWRTDLGAEALPERRLAGVGSAASALSVAPDGATAAWLQGGDLWFLELAGGAPEQVTRLGLPPLSASRGGRYSRPEREIGPGTWGGPRYRWSPDGRYIAVHRVDRRHLRRVPFPDYLAPETDPNPVRRGYPGDANERRQVGLLAVAQRRLTLLPLPQPEANQVVDFDWSSRGELLLDVASDTAVDRWLYTLDPDDGRLTERWHSHRASRVYTAFAARWHPDGETLVFLSDRGDRYGLYALRPGGGDAPPQRLTDPGRDVLSAPRFGAAGGRLFYNGAGAAPRDQQVYTLGEGSSRARQLTSGPGTHDGYPSPDGRRVAVLRSADLAPPDLYLAPGDGGELTRITRSPLPAFRERDWATVRYLAFPGPQARRKLHARLLLPPDFDAKRRYPVIFGPVYSNTVRNRWRGVYSAVQQLLALRGYLVMQVDVTGSTGYGRAFREAFLSDFAGRDIEDIASAVRYLETLPYADTRRLGIWGSSYGGTLAVYTLLQKPGLFRAAVAAAAAVDPRFFGSDDVAIVRRPDSNPGIFERRAADLAPRLQDRLLLIHGMQDQVVPFKTAVVLADALIRAGKDFDFAIGPGATHGWSGESPYNRYLFGKLLAFFDRHLAPREGPGP